MTDAVERVIQSAGSAIALARRLSEVGERITPQAIYQWHRNGIPAKRVLHLESITGIPRYELLPDVYGPAPQSTEAA